jgi:microcin C transport system substrate-binding protein
MSKSKFKAVAKTQNSHQARQAFGLLSLALIGLFVLSGAKVVLSKDLIKAHGISTFGDLKYGGDFTHLDYVNPDAPKGGYISEWTQGGFDSMNPFSLKGRAGAMSSTMLESLLAGTSDEIGASYCLICETMEYPQDRSSVIFNLRKDVTFSDGTPLTADDVIFSFETFLSKGLTDFRTVLSEQVESARALDPYRVEFTFTQGKPTRDLPADMGGLPIFSKAHYQSNGLDLEESNMTPLLGSGPYVPDRVIVGQTLSYKRNPNYWGVVHPLMKGTNNFDEIRIEYFSDGNAAFEAFKAGTYTFRNENSSKSWATSYDFPALEAGHVVKAELPSGDKASGQAFLFNLRREKFQDLRVREAIALMFNFEWSNETLFYGLYARINSVWENTWQAAEGTPRSAELSHLQPLVDAGLLQPTILTNTAINGDVSGAKQLDRGNLRKASALLDAAGWAVGSDGMRANAVGEKLRVEFLNDSPAFDRVILPYVENLKALGIDAMMTKVDDAQYTDRTRPPSYDFDIISSRARSGYFSGSELKQFYGSQTADVSAFNVMGLKSAAVDRLIDDVMAATSKQALTDATMALDRVLRAERFWVPQWYKNKHTVAYYDQYEHPQTLPPYALGELDFWWFNPEKAAKLKSQGALR